MTSEYLCENILPYDEQGSKREQVTRMFDNISKRYDRMNRLMTLGIDICWRNHAIAALRPFNPQLILDVATGTGDFAIEAYRQLRPQRITGIDLSEKMLDAGRQKIAKLELGDCIELHQADATQLTYDNEVFDAVTVAFGVRNFENLEQGIAEMYRVLKPGGHLAILEMSEPYSIFKPLYRLYTRCIIPIVARLYAGDKQAYRYLPSSIQAFPEGKAMTALLRKCGFATVKLRRFSFGVCSFYLAGK
ncbi:MAG: bifunctional demethylmenaquinone methyltransferase/2-methoxy-6-polyprenyl-1,4-benzoquinol methylase UbiE [Prevotellaceae bacterium]|jgi:demethylmenaquinone methyltransferase/2-methoxy-6-polyprenyl-1,4-benzoquinol methylase|nr:bifunctional demethylmenaquinone methyltransferase/2-methoxy-6-polyprenyl-1,4-benzoquinol methylase UbiE [Prevotellaceae bacterium]